MYEDVQMKNQRLWDAYPERATEAALDAISSGGFGTDAIRRRVGNYEGQVMAIRCGWAVKEGYRFTTTDKGWGAFEDNGRQRPTFLGAQDTWHNSRFEYMAKDTEVNGKRALRLFKDAHPSKGRCGMDPALTREDVIQLRDFLNNWLSH